MAIQSLASAVPAFAHVAARSCVRKSSSLTRPPVCSRRLVLTQAAFRVSMCSRLDGDFSARSTDWIDPIRTDFEADSVDVMTNTDDALEGGGGVSGGGMGGRGGRGDSGGRDAGAGGFRDGASGGAGFLSRIWPGWRRRVAADPEFPFKVLMEETVGLGLAASGMIAARGKEIMNELDFAICDIAVGGTLNFILVYLLSPAASPAAAASRPSLLSKMSCLPANVFVTGAFTPAQRAAGFLYKGVLFAVCGFLGSLVGTTLSQGLIVARKALTSEEKRKSKPEKQLPNVAANSAAWAGFMFLSSNPRYQAVAGIEKLLFARAPVTIAKLGCGAARTFNNVAGGAIWVWWARYLGIQEQNPSEK